MQDRDSYAKPVRACVASTKCSQPATMRVTTEGALGIRGLWDCCKEHATKKHWPNLVKVQALK